MAAEDADFAERFAGVNVLHVDVVDAVGEFADEFDVVHALVEQVAGVEVEAEGFVAFEGVDGAFGAGDVEGDFGGVDFEGEADAVAAEFVEDGRPGFGKLVVAARDHLRRDGREAVEEMPDARACEAVDDFDAEIFRGARGEFEFGGGAFVDAFRVAVTPDVRREDALVALVNVVADRLADEVGGDGEKFQAVFRKNLVAAGAIVGVGRGFLHIAMVAPTGEFQAVVAEVFGFFRDVVEGEVGPLSSEECDGTGHGGLRGFKG